MIQLVLTGPNKVSLLMQSETTAPTEIVDASGLVCPMPLLKAKQVLARIKSGETLKLIATDPTSVRDIQAFVGLTEHLLLKFVEQNGSYTYIIQKGESA